MSKSSKSSPTTLSLLPENLKTSGNSASNSSLILTASSHNLPSPFQASDQHGESSSKDSLPWNNASSSSSLSSTTTTLATTSTTTPCSKSATSMNSTTPDPSDTNKPTTLPNTRCGNAKTTSRTSKIARGKNSSINCKVNNSDNSTSRSASCTATLVASPTGQSSSNASAKNPSETAGAGLGHSAKRVASAPTDSASGGSGLSVSSNKMPHLKKEDGFPLWRRDIQYDFLKYVFESDQRVFRKPGNDKAMYTFADLYIDCMASSSKCSRILQDKLLMVRSAAINMAKVCLLVNVGRMNTTLNFFPEMRAQLRTYHSIPSLQAHQDANSYKQLQDAPRLKSILKGAVEDTQQPTTLDELALLPAPRSNPVSLIFLLTQYAPKVSALHFDSSRDLFDLIMMNKLSSRSRAQAFLWLMWWYLESDFSKESALNNPFGSGRYGDYPLHLPIKCPEFEYLTDKEAEKENVDTADELEFGEQKRLERLVLLCSRGEEAIMDSSDRRLDITPASRREGSSRKSLGNGKRGAWEEGAPTWNECGSGESSMIGTEDVGGNNGVEGEGLGKGNHVQKRARGRSSYQLAVEKYRQEKTKHSLDQQLRILYRRVGRKRNMEGLLLRCWMRLKDEKLYKIKVGEDEILGGSNYDSEEERPDVLGGFMSIGGLLPATWELENLPDDGRAVRITGSMELKGNGRRGSANISSGKAELSAPIDWGEEAYSIAQGLRRCQRRLRRWIFGEENVTSNEQGKGDKLTGEKKMDKLIEKGVKSVRLRAEKGSLRQSNNGTATGGKGRKRTISGSTSRKRTKLSKTSANDITTTEEENAGGSIEPKVGEQDETFLNEDGDGLNTSIVKAEVGGAEIIAESDGERMVEESSDVVMEGI